MNHLFDRFRTHTIMDLVQKLLWIGSVLMNLILVMSTPKSFWLDFFFLSVGIWFCLGLGTVGLHALWRSQTLNQDDNFGRMFGFGLIMVLVAAIGFFFIKDTILPAASSLGLVNFEPIFWGFVSVSSMLYLVTLIVFNRSKT